MFLFEPWFSFSMRLAIERSIVKREEVDEKKKKMRDSNGRHIIQWPNAKLHCRAYMLI
jgi:hypothetical protein